MKQTLQVNSSSTYPHWPDHCGHGQENFLFTVDQVIFHEDGSSEKLHYDVFRMEELPGGSSYYCRRYGPADEQYMSSLTLEQLEAFARDFPGEGQLYALIARTLRARGEQ